MTDKVPSGTGLERDLIRKVAEIEYIVTSHGAFLRCARYRPIERLAYARMRQLFAVRADGYDQVIVRVEYSSVDAEYGGGSGVGFSR